MGITSFFTNYFENSKYYKTIRRMPCYTELIKDDEIIPVITGSLEKWRTSYPSAIIANISNRKDICDIDFIYLKGIKVLIMNDCNQESITDKAFENLVGIECLKMKNCNQLTITDKAFENLENIKILDMTNCNQCTITENAFNYIKNIDTLYMTGCNQPTIYGCFFVNLYFLTNLKISFKEQAHLIVNGMILGFDFKIPKKYKKKIKKMINEAIYNYFYK